MFGASILFLGVVCLACTIIGIKGEIKLIRQGAVNLQILLGGIVCVGLSSTLVGMGIATVIIQVFGL